jgi:hypothetical protein
LGKVPLAALREVAGAKIGRVLRDSDVVAVGFAGALATWWLADLLLDGELFCATEGTGWA